MKRCSKCNEIKSLNEFWKCKTRKDGLQPQCISCRKKVYKKWYATEYGKRIARKNRQKFRNTDKGKQSDRNHHLKKRYGISLQEYNKLLNAQNGVCAICNKKSETQHLAVDHCHKSGKIRGLLCKRCNTRLGILENSDFVEKAKKYCNKIIGLKSVA